MKFQQLCWQSNMDKNAVSVYNKTKLWKKTKITSFCPWYLSLKSTWISWTLVSGYFASSRKNRSWDVKSPQREARLLWKYASSPLLNCKQAKTNVYREIISNKCKYDFKMRRPYWKTPYDPFFVFEGIGI